jgi:hypothetical protein
MGVDTLRAHGHPGTDRARGAESNYAPVRAGPIPSTGSGSSYAAQQVRLNVCTFRPILSEKVDAVEV